MSEEKKEEAVDIPVLNISKEMLEENKKQMEEAKSILTPPEGQVLAGLRSFCPVHGDITRASRIIKYTTYMKSEEDGKVHPISSSDCICLACVSDWWKKTIVANYPKEPNGTPGQVKIAPVFISKEEYEKLVAEQKEAAKESAESANTDTKAEASAEAKPNA